MGGNPYCTITWDFFYTDKTRRSSEMRILLNHKTVIAVWPVNDNDPPSMLIERAQKLIKDVTEDRMTVEKIVETNGLYEEIPA